MTPVRRKARTPCDPIDIMKWIGHAHADSGQMDDGDAVVGGVGGGGGGALYALTITGSS